MSFSVTMPALGESVSEGTVTRWLKQEGDSVEVDEPLLEVSTDKVDTEIPSPAAGVLQRIVVTEDETVEVGAELAVIGDAAEGGGDGGAPQQQASPDGQQGAPAADGDQGGQPAEGEQQAAPAPAEQAGTQYPAAEEGVPTPSEQPQRLPDADTEQAGAGGTESGGTESDGGGGASGGGTTVTMPALGESVSEGTVTRWLKQVGETVEVDEPLLEVSTDKVDTEIPSPAAGTLLSVAVDEDETVPVGAELAVIGEPSAGAGGGAQPAQPAAESAPPPQQEQQEQQQEQEQAPQPDQQPEQQAAPESAPQDRQQPAQQQPAQQQPQAAPQQPPAQRQAPAEPATAGGDGNAYVTPLVRRLAAEQDVDLSSLRGTGVGGRIRKQDVLDAAAKAAEAPQEQPQPTPAGGAGAPTRGGAAATVASVSPLRGTTEKMSRLRKVIAQRMVESLQTSAQLTTVVEVDITTITRLRDRAKRDFATREGVKLSFLPFFAKAAVEALKAHPKLNASVDGDTIVYHGQENLGVAVDTERGLLVPVIRDAGDLNIAGLARKIADLAERTRSNKIGPDELGGGTFTLTNTGSRGALFDTPIINQPQVGILGTGAVVKRPAVLDHPELGEIIGVRSMVYLALSYDHRIVDGADAARFLATVKQRLEEGRFEGDLGL